MIPPTLPQIHARRFSSVLVRQRFALGRAGKLAGRFSYFA